MKEQIELSCSIPQGAIDKVVLTTPVKFEEWKKDMLKHAAILQMSNLWGLYKKAQQPHHRDIHLVYR